MLHRLSRTRSPAAVTCPACGSDKARLAQRLEEFHESDVHGEYRYEITECDECGEEILSFEQAETQSRAYAAAVARARGTPSSERFLELRMTLNWSQTRMEDAFGVGPKTWGRWERGMVAPSGPAARLLWIAENDRQAFFRMVESHTNQPERSIKVVGSIARQGINEPAVGFSTPKITRSGGRSGNASLGPSDGGAV